jgi:hypothetical protein
VAERGGRLRLVGGGVFGVAGHEIPWVWSLGAGTGELCGFVLERRERGPAAQVLPNRLRERSFANRSQSVRRAMQTATLKGDRILRVAWSLPIGAAPGKRVLLLEEPDVPVGKTLPA